MNYLKVSTPFYLVALLTFCNLNSYGQVTVYNNFGQEHNGWNYNYQLGWTISGNNVTAQYGVEQALGFQSEFDGIVSDIWLAISLVPSSTQPDTVIFRLTTNPLGLPPDTSNILEEWILTEFQSWTQWNNPIHLIGNGTSELLAGQSYWLWAIGKETTWCMWCMNEDPDLTAPHTIRRENENWLSISNETAGVFRVDIEIGTDISNPNYENTENNFLHQNYPNPFKNVTNIKYTIEKSDFVNLRIIDINGMEVQTIVSEFQDKGDHTVNFDASMLKQGINFYKLEVGNKIVDVKKLFYQE